MSEISLEDREDILKRHRWTPCETNTRYGIIWETFWGRALKEVFHKETGWPEWIEGA